MATFIESGGRVVLGGAWVISLPRAYHETNPDGSWAAWGEDWAVDAHLVTVEGDANGEPVAPEDMLGTKAVNIKGSGWIGNVEILQEKDNGRDVYRLAANLAAMNTSMSFWVSYFTKSQQSFAESLVRSVIYAR
jgi:hypothetical protein